MPKQRIQKILAAAGFGSRRYCEQLVLDNRVSVNGQPLHQLPALVDSDVDRIAVDGRPVKAEKPAYFMLNKPAGVFCTHLDQAGRARAVDLLVGVKERVYPVGRLETESMGLLILTNDGPLTQKLTHPRFGVPKTYRVEVPGRPSSNALEKLRGGVWLSEGKTAPAKIEVIHSNAKRTIMEITLREGRNREIRRMLAKLGHNVRRLVRVRIGRLSIAKLPLGAFRRLTESEIKYLKSLAERGSTMERPESTVRFANRPWTARPTARRRATGSRAVRLERPREAAPRGRTILLPDGPHRGDHRAPRGLRRPRQPPRR